MSEGQQIFCFGKSINYVILKYESSTTLEWLSIQEQSVWYEDKIHRRGGNDWLAGRFAIKKAILNWSLNKSKEQQNMNEITILNDANGAPVLVDMPYIWLAISLSHKQSMGFAIASDDYPFVGCDMEKLTYRSEKMIPFFSSESEYKLWEEQKIHRDVVTLLWVMKEAAIKCLRRQFGAAPLKLDKIVVTPSVHNNFLFAYPEDAGSSGVHGQGIVWIDHEHAFALCATLQLY
ncbi:4'-phosphopantetheinyl transferase family protein [Paenibacillus koleovorans]|uniref:4'-phosphopantetheinyl transferase family protein n=1 Tax=Paenibacillus koleovorans TaxID=121608 RepID=UPI0013E3E9E8|nr:4'-phosphopantetheinyl transferase superfamily protein [Paenibacillus koleovorans]